MTFPPLPSASSANAQVEFNSLATQLGIRVAGLDPISQLQLVGANLLTTGAFYPLLVGEVGVVDLSYPPGHALRHGVAPGGSGLAAKIQNVLTSVAAVATIRTLIFPPGDYDCGNVSAGAAVFTVTGIDDLTIDGPGARFLCTTTDSTVCKIWLFIDCERLTVDIKGYDNGYDQTQTWKGAHLVYISTNQVSGTLERYDLTLHAEHMLSAFAVDGISGARIRDIRIDVTLLNCYYGPNYQNNGDNVRGHVYALNPRRAYFAYGVHDHDVDVRVEGDADGIGADGCLVVARYGNAWDTTGIKLRASFGGTLPWGTLVKLSQIDAAGAGAEWIDDLELTVDVDRDATIDGGTYVLEVQDETSGGVVHATTAAHFDRIRLAGNAFNNAAQAINIQSAQATEGRLTLDATYLARPGVAQPHFPGFVVRTAPNREFRTLKGDLTSQTVTIPLSGYDGAPFTFRVTVCARDGGLAAGNSLYQTDVIDGWNASGAGGVGFTATTLHTIARNTPPTVSYTASGDGISVSFAGAGFTGDNCFAHVACEYATPGQVAA